MSPVQIALVGLVVAAVSALVVVLILRNSTGEADAVAEVAAEPVRFRVLEVPEALPEQLRKADVQRAIFDALADGRRDQAAKLVRRQTGIEAGAAEEIVDELEVGWRSAPAPAVEIADDGGLLAEPVRALVLAGDRATAIALVRTETGMTAEEAERYVDRFTETTG